MLRLLFFTTFCIASFILTECRMGWKSNGTEYFVYSANTSSSNTANSTYSFNITGKFSIKPGTTEKNQLVVVKDINGQQYLFEVYINDRDKCIAVVSQSGSKPRTGELILPAIRSGYAFDFTITVTQSEDNGTYNHAVKTELRGHPSFTVTTKDNIKWDPNKMKLFVGGYSAASVITSYFYGCLSNVMFQGVDIIATYFSQYPNNTNPVRGSVVGSPPYATEAQNCDDVMSTVGPTASTSPTASAPSTAKITPKPSAPSTAKTTPTKKPGAAASYKASVFILVVAFLFPLFSF